MSTLLMGMRSGDIYPEHKREATIYLLALIAEGRNTFDPLKFIEKLSEDVIYESQNSFDKIEGKKAVSDYLLDRYSFIKEQAALGKDTGRVYLGEVDSVPYSQTPCLIFEQAGRRLALWMIQLDGDDLIARLDIITIAPHPDTARLMIKN